jgi:hypothetical protein
MSLLDILGLNDVVADTGGDYEPIPEGDYELIISNIEQRENSKGTGSYISCTFQVTEGEFADRKIFINFNISHVNKKAEDIGKAQFKSLILATNKNPLELEDLIGQTVKASVKITPPKGDYPASNTIKKYFIETPEVIKKIEKNGIPF